MLRINNNWEFTTEWSESFKDGSGKYESVRLPHTVQESPLHYASPRDYEMISGYRRYLKISKEDLQNRIFIQFDGAAHIATLYVNGIEAGSHRCGYTSFRVEITKYLHEGKDNLIAVCLDSTENSSIPPFGYVIDYLTFGGLYRDVWLDIRGQSMISDMYVTTPRANSAHVDLHYDGDVRHCTVQVMIKDSDGNIVEQQEIDCKQRRAALDCPDALVWSVDEPNLYTCTALLKNASSQVIDQIECTFGFRTMKFVDGKFYLNNSPLFLRGLNRHQSYPYIGYAATASLQKEDARILKEELCCNAVRTSHYPQSQDFLDECDRIGLLVFTEIPGWQHIGDAAWKEQACKNVEEMVLQYRQHPSIFLWGVRINESLDDDDFYKRTNEIAHSLDLSRKTSGVRYLEKSHLLEDVYSYNDFSHRGDNAGAKRKKEVMSESNKSLIISEANGHMYPTKSYDSWSKRQEHALRHARVLDAAIADGDHAGCFQWCMFDYSTHADFGSGDRICYHGVLDSFRNPKLAASLYSSQGEEVPVLEVGSSMDIGDYPAGDIGDVYCFTNADKISLYKDDHHVADFMPKDWQSLSHGPIKIDDMIGELLETQENFSAKNAKLIHEVLTLIKIKDVSGLSVMDKAKIGKAMIQCRIKYNDLIKLYGKYVGNWGGEATKWRFDAVKGGKVVASCVKTPSLDLHIEAKESSAKLTDGDAYDMAAIRLRILDQNGNLAPYAQIPLTLECSGAVSLVGPSVVTAEGGMTGTYVKTIGKAGKGQITISSPVTEPVSIEFSVELS